MGIRISSDFIQTSIPSIMKSFSQKIKDKDNLIGTWVISPSVHSLNAICCSGLDFVILDQEHGAISNNNLLPLIKTAKANNVASLVRPASINKESIQHALDQGAEGIQVPNIETKEDAKKVINFSKFPPLGSRGYSPFVPASKYVNNGPEWNFKMNQDLITGINIEGDLGIENIEEIITLEDLDIIFIGLFDLSKSMGIPGNIYDDGVNSKLKEVVEKTNSKNVSIGTIATSKSHMKELISLGVNFIVYLTDMNILTNSYIDICDNFKKSKNQNP